MKQASLKFKKELKRTQSKKVFQDSVIKVGKAAVSLRALAKEDGSPTKQVKELEELGLGSKPTKTKFLSGVRKFLMLRKLTTAGSTDSLTKQVDSPTKPKSS